MTGFWVIGGFGPTELKTDAEGREKCAEDAAYSGFLVVIIDEMMVFGWLFWVPELWVGPDGS